MSEPKSPPREGVFQGIALCVRRAYGGGLDGVTVAIQGVGHVGGFLADKLKAAGARLVLTDVNTQALRAVAERTGARVVEPDAIFDVDAQVFAPCAMGGAIAYGVLDRLKAKVIAGGANNQLATPEVGRVLFQRGLIYAPDYVINGGGIINVAAEIRAIDAEAAYDPAWVQAKLDRLMLTLEEILERSRQDRRPTHEIAAEIAKARIVGARA